MVLVGWGTDCLLSDLVCWKLTLTVWGVTCDSASCVRHGDGSWSVVFASCRACTGAQSVTSVTCPKSSQILFCLVYAANNTPHQYNLLKMVTRAKFGVVDSKVLGTEGSSAFVNLGKQSCGCVIFSSVLLCGLFQYTTINVNLLNSQLIPIRFVYWSLTCSCLTST